MSDEIKDLAPMPARENRGMVRVGDLLKFAERPDCDPAKMREVYAFAKEVMADEIARRNRDFLDGLEVRAIEHPDEGDPFWEKFWQLKRSSDS